MSEMRGARISKLALFSAAFIILVIIVFKTGSASRLPFRNEETPHAFMPIILKQPTLTPTVTSTSTQTSTPTPTSTPAPVSFCENPNKPIPDQDFVGVSVQIFVPDTRTLADLNLLLNISHAYVGDLIVSLQHAETGTLVTLIDRPGKPAFSFGCPHSDIVATLDDEAASPVEDACSSTPPAISGSFTPNNPLSAFDGQSISGYWTLRVVDRASQHAGTLNQWCLNASLGSASQGSSLRLMPTQRPITTPIP